jgi:hypothetical protein
MASSRLIGIHFGRAAQTKLPDAGLQVFFHLQEHFPHVGDAQLTVPVLFQKPPLPRGDLIALADEFFFCLAVTSAGQRTRRFLGA